jgi:hypothetical protein
VLAAEHDAADLDAPDAALAVEGDRERLGRELELRDVRQELPGVDVDGVAARGAHDGDAGRG